MKISDIGEFALIKRLTNRVIDDKNVIKGIGDDCAVLRYTDDKYLLVTTDMIVENDHFNLDWSTPYQIGMKLMEVNVSDIVAMGGIPKYAFVSMSIKKETTVEFMDELFRGINDSGKVHGVMILGGDTTHGTELVFSITLVGEVDITLVKYRTGAKVGELICTTGKLGGSAAGLNLLLANKDGYLKDHLEPKSRLASEGKIIAKYATAMIDVSDGLYPEVNHICEESRTGAEIIVEKIPLSAETIKTARSLSASAEDYALYGGEDFELVFTIREDDVAFLKKEFDDFTVVGKILDLKDGVRIIKNNMALTPKKGYDHFS